MTERGALSKGFTGSEDEGGYGWGGGWFVAAVPGDNGCENDLQEEEVAAKATVNMTVVSQR